MCRICSNKEKFGHAKKLFHSKKNFNVYKLNILNVAIFMCKVSHMTTPNIFLSAFQKPSHFYPAYRGCLVQHGSCCNANTRPIFLNSCFWFSFKASIAWLSVWKAWLSI